MSLSVCEAKEVPGQHGVAVPERERVDTAAEVYARTLSVCGSGHAPSKNALRSPSGACVVNDVVGVARAMVKAMVPA